MLSWRGPCAPTSWVARLAGRRPLRRALLALRPRRAWCAPGRWCPAGQAYLFTGPVHALAALPPAHRAAQPLTAGPTAV
eukprot:7746822-Lingulodinium_polyedra.AAC.1